MNQLAKKFFGLGEYEHANGSYHFLPFNFIRIGPKVLLTNLTGEYTLLSEQQFSQFTTKTLETYSAIYNDLKSRHFLFDADSSAAIDLLSLKYRTKQARLANFTSLHMFVVTLRCDYSCPYCQVSRQSEDKSRYDMSFETANKSLDLVFQSPSENIKIEFQGGEPLLNFSLIQHIVIEAIERNKVFGKNLQFVIATNLSFISDEVLDFVEQFGIYISTSLDGPEKLHNKNRPRPGKNGYQLTVDNINLVRDRIGPERISALMTTTELSLDRYKEIIDEYIKQGFRSIFLRPLSPYGFAVKTKQVEKYNVSTWLEFYKKALGYILEINKNGYFFREGYTAIILEKMLTPFNPGYVDLQSPSGLAISAVVYNYDGYVYASDEARMLAEMGNKDLQIGNIHRDNYEDIFANEYLLDILESTITNSVPMCTDCVYQNYCGSDPVYHIATQKDPVVHKGLISFCNKNMRIIEHLIDILEHNNEDSKILRSWVH